MACEYLNIAAVHVVITIIIVYSPNIIAVKQEITGGNPLDESDTTSLAGQNVNSIFVLNTLIESMPKCVHGDEI